MREIKLRGWDKVEKDFSYISLHPGSMLMWASQNYTDQTILDGDCGVSFRNIEEWDQFTGLQDKNGKDVYEGDTVKCHHDGLDFVSKVFYDTGAFVVKENEDYEPCLFEMHSYEVIGSIHENQELLK